ncbi:hypothetical protein [Nocardia sp. NPDC051570]|uniref:hypothetical protein n=1 Tax=Nocardia sp. NPDC051570 TaxID=3364324 RepID=UPI003799EDC3
MAARSMPQPPFSTDLLADLHADNLPPELSEQLWPQVREDPQALNYLRDLDDVQCQLRMLTNDSRVFHPMPGPVSARLDRLLEDLSRPTPSDEHVATVHHLPVTAPQPRSEPADAPPSTRPMPLVEALEPDEPIRLDGRRSRRLRWLTAAAAAVAVIAGSLVAVDAVRGKDTPPNALPAKPSPTVALDEGDMSTGMILSAMGRHDVTGPLSSTAALTSCAAAAIPGRQILGSMNVTYAKQPAVLILLTGPRAPRITVLIVGTGCRTGDPQILATQDIGG